MKRILSLLLAFLFCSAFLSGCRSNGTSSEHTDSSWQHVSEKKLLTVGVYSNNFPMTSRDENGKFSGYDIDVMEEVAKRLSLDIQFVSIDTQGAWNALSLNQVDCICSGFAYTDAKEELFLLSDVYFASRHVFVVRSDSTASDLSDLSGMVLGLMSGGKSETALKDASVLTESLQEIQHYSSDFSVLDALVRGDIEVAAVSETSAAFYMHSGHAIRYLTDLYNEPEIITSEEYVVAVKRGNAALMAKLEETFSTMKRDGLMSKYSARWFTSDLSVGTSSSTSTPSVPTSSATDSTVQSEVSTESKAPAEPT